MPGPARHWATPALRHIQQSFRPRNGQAASTGFAQGRTRSLTVMADRADEWGEESDQVGRSERQRHLIAADPAQHPAGNHVRRQPRLAP